MKLTYYIMLLCLSKNYSIIFDFFHITDPAIILLLIIIKDDIDTFINKQLHCYFE